MKALVYKSTGSWYTVKDEHGKTWNARIKGIFKIDDITSTNPVAVGDKVEIDIDIESENSAVISKIYDRVNYVARSSPHNRMQHHIVASNLDQTILLATLKDPKTSQGFIDRFLIAAESFHIPAHIVFNKSDLYRRKEMDHFNALKQMYSTAGYAVFLMSMQNGEGLDAIKSLLSGKTTLLSGHSGVGKSTFINAAFPCFELRTGEVSGWSGKGMHTTTFAEMFDLPAGIDGRIIDTPGMREFGLTDIPRNELSHYFPEMRKVLQDCKFNNCLHMEEPGCAVKEAVLEKKITEERYISYCNILDSITENRY